MEDGATEGEKPHYRDRELAGLSLAVYDRGSLGYGQWKRVTDDKLKEMGIKPASLESPECGFRAGIFSDGRRHVLAFAGTDEWKEITTNTAQAIGLDTSQYRLAVALARRAEIACGKDLVLTGHSLGGGLASLAATAINVQGVTFNASGLHRNSLARVGVDAGDSKRRAANGLIRAYSVEGEILTKAQDILPIPTAAGERVVLSDPVPLKGIRSVLPVSRTIHSIKLHGMKSVMAAMEKDPRFKDNQPDLAKTVQKHAGEFLKQAGMSDKSVSLVTDALARRIEKETAAGRFPPKSPSRDLGRSR